MPEVIDGTADVPTELPCRFNPSDTTVGGMGGILGNATPSAYMTKNGDLGDYPVFIEPLLAERDQDVSEDHTATWGIAEAIKYLLATETSDEQYVSWPTFSTLDSLLNVRYPNQGYETLWPRVGQHPHCEHHNSGLRRKQQTTPRSLGRFSRLRWIRNELADGDWRRW